LGTTETEVVKVKVAEPVVNTKPPSDIDKVSLDDPSEIANMVCVSHLEQVIAQYHTQIQAAQAQEVRVDPFIRKKWMEFKKTSMQI
jgi:hypothetical protein